MPHLLIKLIKLIKEINENTCYWGAGYIGSHMLRFLNSLNYDVEIIDDLSTGNLWAVNGFKLHELNLNEKEKLNNIFETNEYDSVIHFAAKSLVGESNSVPIDYYANNISGTINLLDCMLKHNVNKLIFSSSAKLFLETLNLKRLMRTIQ